jgi:hypothetical protein
MLKRMNTHDMLAMPEPRKMKTVAKYIGCREKLYAPFVIKWSAGVVMKFKVASAIEIKPIMKTERPI